MSGLNLRLKDLFETYSPARGGPTKRKLFNFLLLAHSHNFYKRLLFGIIILLKKEDT
ncbi:hypothetical protein [Globicatella sanguinis]